MRYLFLLNPTAGKRDCTAGLTPAIHAAAGRAGIPPEMSASTSTGKPLRPLRPKLLRTAYMGDAPFCPTGGGRAIKIF